MPTQRDSEPTQLKEANMTLSNHFHEQLAAVYRRDLLDAADRDRLAAQARERSSMRQLSRWTLNPQGLRRAVVDACGRATTPRTATR
jgi:hypothetical protein